MTGYSEVMPQVPGSGLRDHTVGALRQFSHFVILLFKSLDSQPQHRHDILPGQALAVLGG